MGNLERSLAFAGLAMVAGCDDSTTAGGRSNYDAGCYGDGACGDLGVDAAKDLGASDSLVLADGRVADAALNAEFLCESNSDCLPLQYCRELGEDVGSVCRDNPTGPNEAVQPDVDLCGTNQDCPEDEYCHVDGTVNGSACVANPTGPIERPDADSGVSPRLDGGANPPTPDAAVVRPDAAVVVRPDGAVVDQDGAVVPRPDAAVIAADGAVVNLDAMIATDGPLSAEAGVDAASDAGDASDGSSDAADAEPDVFNNGPFPPLVDAAAGDAVRADARATDGSVSVTDAAGVDAVATDAIATDGPVSAIDAARVDASATDAILTDGPVTVTDATGVDAGLTDAVANDGSAAVTDAASSDALSGDGSVAGDGTIDAGEIPEEPCGGPCPEGQLCDPVEDVCAEPNCTVNEDCADPSDRCFVEGQGPGEGVCVSPDLKLAFEIGHGDGTIHGLSTTNLDRQSWNVPPEVTNWSGNLDTRDQGVALLVPAPLEALTAHCGTRARCVLRQVDNGLFSIVSSEGVPFGPNENVALPGGVNVFTVEDVRTRAAEELVGACFFAQAVCDRQ